MSKLIGIAGAALLALALMPTIAAAQDYSDSSPTVISISEDTAASSSRETPTPSTPHTARRRISGHSLGSR